MYNAIVTDGIKRKSIMTKMVFETLHVPNTMITWNLTYDDWFAREKLARNQKLKRLTAPPVSPLVVALLTKSRDIVHTLLQNKVKPDMIDFGNDRGLKAT